MSTRAKRILQMSQAAEQIHDKLKKPKIAYQLTEAALSTTDKCLAEKIKRTEEWICNDNILKHLDNPSSSNRVTSELSSCIVGKRSNLESTLCSCTHVSDTENASCVENLNFANLSNESYQSIQIGNDFLNTDSRISLEEGLEKSTPSGREEISANVTGPNAEITLSNDPYEFTEDSNIPVDNPLTLIERQVRNCPESTLQSNNNLPYTEVNELDFNDTTLINNIDSDVRIDLSEISYTSADDSRDLDFDIEEQLESENSQYTSGSELAMEETGAISNAVSCGQHIKANISSIHNNTMLFKNGKLESTRKPTRCKFCATDILSKNFVRHLETHHRDQNEVQRILIYPKNTKLRRHAFSLLRNSTNFELYMRGEMRPYKTVSKENPQTSYYPCIYCKGLFKKQYLKRHSKRCNIQKGNIHTKSGSGRHNYITESQTFAACAMDPTNVISRLNVKEKVFNLMKGDDVSLEAKKDLLIVHFGESYLKKHKRERKEYAASSRMRELSRLLIAFRNFVPEGNTLQFKDILKPKYFDAVLAATRQISGYDAVGNVYKTPSLAMHLGTYLKQVCDELQHLILKESAGFTCQTKDQAVIWQKDIENFKCLVSTRWNTEISSVANKDLQQKRWNKPLLVPLVSDIKIFREEAMKIALQCQEEFKDQSDNIETYKRLTNCALALLILFNRRRIGDVQYLKITDYKKETKSNFADFENALSEGEKILTKKYKRVVNSGKGSRAVVILVPPQIDAFIKILLDSRYKYLPERNEYVFAIPKSKVMWGQGDVAIRTLVRQMQLQQPEAISSNKLRKQIATVAQILSLSKDELKQFSQFMGHTEKTHAEFYELPIDIYQTAKVSKILLLMEKGKLPLEYKGKSLQEIDIDNEDFKYAEENIPGGVLDRKAPTAISGPSDILNDKFTSICTSSLIEGRLENPSNQSELQEKAMHVAATESGFEGTEGNTSCRKKTGKQCWTEKDVRLLKKAFKTYIDQKKYPSSAEIKDFLQKTGLKRTVVVTKAKLQHLMK